MPFCAICGAPADEPVSRCPQCAPALPPVTAEPVANAPTGRVVGGCLAVAGGLGAGATASVLVWGVLAMAGGPGLQAEATRRTIAHAATIVVIGLSLVALVLLVGSAKKRDLMVQLFAVSTLVAFLGLFATCSSLFFLK